MSRIIDPKITALLTKEQLEKDYMYFRNFTKIAQKYNVCKQTISKYIHQYEIEYDKSKYSCDLDFFTKDTEESFYVAGFIAADGCITVSNGALMLALQIAEKDIVLLRKIKLAMNSEHPIHLYQAGSNNGKKYPSCKITIGLKKVIQSLERFNITERKSLTYKFPEWLIEHKLVNHFMRGYSDGDGSFYQTTDKRNGSKSIRYRLCGTRQFLDKYIYIIKESSNIKNNTYINKYNNIFYLDINGNKANKMFTNFLYRNATIKLDRKYNIIKHLFKQ